MRRFLSALALLVLIQYVLACNMHDVHVHKIGNASASNPLSTRYDLKDVDAHFTQKVILMESNIETTFACVDARNNDHVFGTPGGDFSEFTAALQVYFKMIGQVATEKNIEPLFKSFVEKYCSEERPFYYHTDEAKLQKLFDTIGQITQDVPSIFPWDTPENSTLWLDLFVKPEHQGCGHIRLMLQNPVAYGLDSTEIVENMLRVFVKYWWAQTDENKKRITFIAKLGSLTGRAVAIINTISNSSECLKQSPAVIASTRGSTTFIYHQNAVTEFRKNVLTPFFASKNKKVSKKAFTANLETLTKVQLDQTLGPTGLNPANQVDLFLVQVTATAEPTKKKVNGLGIAVAILVIVIVALIVIVGILVGFNLFGARNWIKAKFFKASVQKASSDLTSPWN
jgi:hypothetical protein